MWQHVWKSGAHREVLRDFIQQFRLRGTSQTEEEAAFTLYGLALADKERACCPRVGLATDRRTLGHIGEVFHEENIQTLVCFICGCKHVCHEGVDKFGKPQQKGTISVRRHVHLQKLLQSVGAGSGKYNHSFTFYKDRFGKATAAAPDLQDGCMEWKKLVSSKQGDDEVLCCPEDVCRTSLCQHDAQHVCAHCNVPVCNECWRLSLLGLKIPKALANDNFIGYVHRFLVEQRVTWLEATIAGPVFPGLVTYYIEGQASERHHMMEEVVGKPERAWGVRGNLRS